MKDNNLTNQVGKTTFILNRATRHQEKKLGILKYTACPVSVRLIHQFATFSGVGSPETYISLVDRI